MDQEHKEEGAYLYTSTPTYNYDYDHEKPVISQAQVVNRFFSILFPSVLFLLSFSFFVFILTKKDLRRKPTVWFVINVLVGLMIEGISVLMLIILKPIMANVSWRAGNAGCVLLSLMVTISDVHINVALFLLMIDRLIYFIKQKNYHKTMTPKAIRISMICCVIAEVIACITSTIISMPYAAELTNGQTACFRSEYGWMIKLVPFSMNIILGFITFVYTLINCHRLNEGNTEECSRSKHAVAFNILIGTLEFSLCAPFWILNLLLFTRYFADYWIWILLVAMYNLFQLLVSILVMVLVPDVKNEMLCCKKDKLDESSPLIKPM